MENNRIFAKEPNHMTNIYLDIDRKTHSATPTYKNSRTYTYTYGDKMTI